jgi:hypothetical protein
VVRQANETAKRKQPIAAALPPVVAIVSPQTGSSFFGGQGQSHD